MLDTINLSLLESAYFCHVTWSTGFDVKITMFNGISEQTSNLTMAFFRYLISFLSRHLTDRWHFLSSCNF